MAEMRDSVDSYLTAYTSEGSDPVGYPFGQLPQYSTDDIPMAETAYGATFGDLGRHRHHHHGGGRGPGPGWWGPWPWYQPFEVAGAIVQPEPVILDESGEPQRDEDEKKKKGLSSFAMNRLHEVARQLPLAERRMFLVEIEDPSFVAYISRFLTAADPVREVMNDALRAISNEFNSRSYPTTRGYWNYLRGMARKLTVDIPRMIGESVEGMSPERRIAAFEKLRDTGLSGGSGMGWVEELIGSVTQATGALLGAKLQADAAKDIAKIQAQAQAQQTELAAKMAQAQIAMQQAQMTPGAPGYVAPRAPETKVLGVPWWAALLGVVAVGGGAYALTR